MSLEQKMNNMQEFPEGSVSAFTPEQEKTERLDAAETAFAGFEGEGTKESPLDDAALAKERIDAIDTQLAGDLSDEAKADLEKERTRLQLALDAVNHPQS